MKGDKAVISALNDVLMAELTAINIYYIHYKMQMDWGYEKLAAHSREESMGEMKHTDLMIDRILFLDGVPNMQKYDTVLVGDNVEAQLKNQYKIELAHVTRVRKHIKTCFDKTDFVSKEILDGILEDTEESVDWLETQFTRIKDMGTQNYLAENMNKEGN
ncbi:MAG: bacterioferritin [Nitrospinae bacterium]|nr:bacterioferritin [Nitrospinota bacterium]MBL7020152.1 bacterioferritin [Nitrospinaceae bacterium]